MVTRRTWESWSELVDYAAGETRVSTKAHDKGRQSRAVEHSSKPWAGTATFDDALPLAREGWAEPIEDIEGIAGRLEESIRDCMVDSFELHHSPAGFAVDMGAYLTGSPLCMLQAIPAQISRAGRVVRVGVNMTASAHVSPDTILRRGAAVCALVHLIERTQNRVEIWGESCQINRTRKGIWSGAVCIKPAGESMDLGLLAFALAHPASLRRILFGAMEREKSGTRNSMGFWRGGSYSMPRHMLQLEGFDVTLPLVRQEDAHRDWQEWIVKQLADLGLTKTTDN